MGEGDISESQLISESQIRFLYWFHYNKLLKKVTLTATYIKKYQLPLFQLIKILTFLNWLGQVSKKQYVSELKKYRQSHVRIYYLK